MVEYPLTTFMCSNMGNTLFQIYLHGSSSFEGYFISGTRICSFASRKGYSLQSLRIEMFLLIRYTFANFPCFGCLGMNHVGNQWSLHARKANCLNSKRQGKFHWQKFCSFWANEGANHNSLERST